VRVPFLLAQRSQYWLRPYHRRRRELTHMQSQGDNHTSGVPVALITGFLGSGKTTLLRNLLSQPGMANSALIINEFGEVGLDHLLVESSFDNILMLDNGCVCCSIRGDLVDTIGDLFAKEATGEIPAFSRILIETTGLADPGPIVRDLTEAMSLRGRCSLRRVVVTIDGVLGPVQLRDTPEVSAQIAQADLCLITKADIAGRNEVNVLLADLRSIGPDLDIRTTSHGHIDAAILFAEDDTSNAPRAASSHHRDHARFHDEGIHHSSAHHHHSGVESWSLRLDRPLSWTRLRNWMEMVYSLRAPQILRMKGVFWLAESDKPVVMHGVAGLVSTPTTLDSWPGGVRESQIVFITKGLGVAHLKASFASDVLAEPVLS
jgi:G3E family GTPase